jgi:hypothetical protein
MGRTGEFDDGIESLVAFGGGSCAGGEGGGFGCCFERGGGGEGEGEDGWAEGVKGCGDEVRKDYF